MAIIPDYEFTPEQNQTIDTLGSNMRLVGLVTCVLGVVYVVDAFRRWNFNYDFWGLIFAGLFYVLLGNSLYISGNHLKKVVESKNNDINHLMRAFAYLGRFFGILAWLIVITGVVLLILALAGVFLYSQWTT